MHQADDTKPLIYRKRVAYAKLGVGRTLGDEMCAAGDLQTVTLGPRAVGVTADSVERVAREGAPKRAAAKNSRSLPSNTETQIRRPGP